MYSSGEQAKGTWFGVYTPQQVKNMSAVEVTESIATDMSGHPLRGGLYDQSMGASSYNSRCWTCSLPQKQCSGHIGHIELNFPLYNPLLFDHTLALLRCTCTVCHRFKCSSFMANSYIRKIRLLDAGLLVDACTINLDMAARVNFQKSKKFASSGKTKKAQKSSKKSAKKADEEEEEEEDVDMDLSDDDDEVSDILDYSETDFETLLKEKIQAAAEAEGLTAEKYMQDIKRYKNTHITKEKLLVLADFFRRVQHINSCQNCKGFSWNFKQEKKQNIFRVPFSAKRVDRMKRLGYASFINYDATQLDDEKFNKASKLNRDTESDEEEDTEEDVLDAGKKAILMNPGEVRAHLKRLWSKQATVLNYLFAHLNKERPAAELDENMFFMTVLPVPSNKFRPPQHRNGAVFEHNQNTPYSKLLELNKKMIEIKRENDFTNNTDGNKIYKDFLSIWCEAQETFNKILDANAGKSASEVVGKTGIKQLVEKKQGLFRKNMMGKRVNFAARSVISPDPCIETSEVGVPLYFAKSLTYPQQVTPWNVKELRKLVINGPDKYPGANYVEVVSKNQLINLKYQTLEERIALSQTLLGGEEDSFDAKKVWRHVKEGDILIVNRQPTLHKSSMMAHKARIMMKHDVIRMHYANCKTYNADFDGDEMNLHLPQSELARAEAYNIVNTDNQYVVPTSGEPIRGLIQDHVVSGVLLTKKDTLLSQADYTQLVYEAVSRYVNNAKIQPVTPAILKPQPMWTGKQVITTVLNVLCGTATPLNLDCKTKIPAKSWGRDSEEGKIIIRDNDLLTGVMDKNQFGASQHGLVHAVFECYGSETAGKLLTSLGRLFTHYLQFRGFTCGIDDALLKDKYEGFRSEQMTIANETCVSITSQYVEVPKLTSKTKKVYQERMFDVIQDEKQMRKLDSQVKASNGKFLSKVNDVCLDEGKVKEFPFNNLSLMTISGAKGAQVNFSQITCLLGQQEFEGKRVRPMPNGKTLPSFEAHDPSARAGGFISQRFLTGIKPQEFWFHCMAGRDGLVDTAVKTSRSGYLQRCLMKHLEGLKVHYDHTVREADGSVVQFHYGEDSLDTIKTSFINQFSFLAMNVRPLSQRYQVAQVADRFVIERHSSPEALQYTNEMKEVGGGYGPKSKYDPLLAKFSPSQHLGAISEKLADAVDNYVAANPDGYIDNGSSKIVGKQMQLSEDNFRAMVNLKYLRSIADAGESVGVLAAQSVGEPSTQMTLNTFHFAGVDMAHVTVGIPRLRELLLTGTTKTGLTFAPFKSHITPEQRDMVATQLSRLTLHEILDEVVSKQGFTFEDGERKIVYTISLQLKQDMASVSVDKKMLQDAIATKFVPILCKEVQAALIKKVSRKKKTSEGDERDDPISKAKNKEKSKKRDDDLDDEAAEASDNEDVDNMEDAHEESRAKKDSESDDEKEEEAGADEDAKANRKKGKYGYGVDEEEEEEEDQTILEEAAANTQTETKEAEAAPQEEEDPLSSLSKLDNFESFKFNFRKRIVEVVLSVNASTYRKVAMSTLVESAAMKTRVRDPPGIVKSFVLEEKDKQTQQVRHVLNSEGINMGKLFEHQDYFDINELKTNDIKMIMNTYGVEAARYSITRELKSVFDAYGIEVTLRHLTLIADYMMFDGKYTAFNRMGMERNSSPWLKMTFETAFGFLKKAILFEKRDQIKTPAACMILGKVVELGTGICEMVHPLTSIHS